jgi:hypothetical protein
VPGRDNPRQHRNDWHQIEACGRADAYDYAMSPHVGELVQTKKGWIIQPPTRCPNGPC